MFKYQHQNSRHERVQAGEMMGVSKEQSEERLWCKRQGGGGRSTLRRQRVARCFLLMIRQAQPVATFQGGGEECASSAPE
jgi:hypothetical protein